MPKSQNILRNKSILVSASNIKDTILKYDTSQKVQYTCLTCNKTVSAELIHFKSRIGNFDKAEEYFYCKGCRRKYVLKHYPDRTIDSSIDGSFLDRNHRLVITKESASQYSEYFRAQKVTLICASCGKPWSTHLGTARVNDFLCRSCKTRITNKLKYGTENINNTEWKKEKTRRTCIERFGVDNPLKTEEVKKIVRDRVSSEDFKQKCRNTWANKTPEEMQKRLNKSRKTNLKRYGFENVFKDKSKMLKAKQNLQASNKGYNYDSKHFDSSWELALWIYARDHNEAIEREPLILKFICDDIEYGYIPDFRYKGKLIEIKGDQFFDKNDNLINLYNRDYDYIAKAKQQCMLKNNVTLWRMKNIQFAIDYVKKTYGVSYLKSFKNSSPKK